MTSTTRSSPALPARSSSSWASPTSPESPSGLTAAGKDRNTPAAVIARGTHADSRSVSGELWDIARLAADLPSPALLVIGDVVAVAPRLAQRPEHIAGDVDGDSLAATAKLR